MMPHLSRSIRATLAAAMLLSVGGLWPRPAAAQQNLATLCTQLYQRLKAGGLVTGIELHGHGPIGYVLYVTKTHWALLNATGKEKVAHIAACFAVHGNPAIQVSGLIEADGTQTQLGVLGMGGGFVAK